MSNNLNELWKAYKNDGSQDAKEQLIIEYVELVKIISGRLYTSFNANVEFDDLVSYGIIGLIDAIDKFDIEKKVKFETYANIRIRGAIVDQIRALDWIPRSTRQRFKQLDEVMNRLHNSHGDNITDDMLAKEMGMSIHDLNKFMGEASALSVMSLDEKLSENSNFSIRSEDREISPEGNLFDKETKKLLMERIDALPERERMIVDLYYFSELTYKEIASVLEISESRISQLHTKAIMKLRGAIEDLY
jgi:RNA polymerase sigma factor for flagellar operon FliA